MAPPFEVAIELDSKGSEVAGTPDVKRALVCAVRVAWSGGLTVLVEASGGDDVKLPWTGTIIVVDMPGDDSAPGRSDVELPCSVRLFTVDVPACAVERLVDMLVTVLVLTEETSGGVACDDAAWDDADEAAEGILLTVIDWEAITASVLVALPMADIEIGVVVSPLSPAMGTDDDFWIERGVLDFAVVVAGTESILPGSSVLVAADDETSEPVGGTDSGVAGVSSGVCA
jgi:hypothetical protein